MAIKLYFKQSRFCKWNVGKESLFEKLCKFCNYKLLYNEIIASPDQYTPETGKPEPNIRAAFVKTKDSKFLTEEEFASFNRIINRPFYAMGPNKVHTPKLW